MRSRVPARSEFGHAAFLADIDVFRKAVERLPAMLAIVDAAGNGLYFNPSLLAYFGTDPSHLDGDGWFRYIHEDDRAAFGRMWRRSRSVDAPLRAEIRLLHPALSEYRRFLVHAVPLGALGPAEDAWVVTCVDVEQTRATEAALEDVSAHLRSTFEASLSSIVLTDTQGRVIAANPKVRERFKAYYGRDLRSGDLLWDVVPQGRTGVVFEGFQRALNGGTWESEYRVETIQGKIVWYVLGCVPIRRGSQVVGVSLSALDITDRKRAEEMRREHEAVLRANRERVETSLRNMASSLEALVAERTEELQCQIAEREAVEADLEVLRQRLVEQGERERVALANGLHDDVLQEVLGLHMNLSNALAAAMDGGEPDDLTEELEATLVGLRTVASALRRTIRGIKPTALEELGLRSALDSFVGGLDVGERPEIVLDFDDVGPLPRDLQVCLYRVGQESIRNAVKHAYAHRIVASLRVQGDQLILHVSDDGVGFEVPNRISSLVREDHFGLASIAEHVMASGGTLHVESGAGTGTVVEAKFAVQR